MDNLNKLKNKILLAAQDISLPISLLQEYNYYLNKISHIGVANEIMLLGYYAQSAMDAHEEEDILIKLGVSNLLMWISYTIYDDIIDDKKGLKRLSLANICLNLSSSMYCYKMDKEWIKFFNNTFQEMESAILWEQNNALLPSIKIYKNKFPDLKEHLTSSRNKSIIHSMPFVYIAYKHTKSLRLSYGIVKFMQKILLFRQLEDDIYDWLEDLKNKKINLAVNIILSSTQIPKKNTLIPKIIYKNLYTVYKIMQTEINNADQYINTVNIINKENYFSKTIKQMGVLNKKNLDKARTLSAIIKK